MAYLLFKDFPTPEIETTLIQPDWICAPIGYCRDSGNLEMANFDDMEKQFDHIDPYGDTWEVAYFPHFACEWTANVFVKPGSKCAELCDTIRAKMADYPCLNEDLWIEYEANEANEGKNGKDKVK